MVKKFKIAAGLLTVCLISFSAISVFAATTSTAPKVFAVVGTVSSISGTVITLNGANNGPTYTVDASKASIVQGNIQVKLSNIKKGDTIIARGTINGT